ADSSFFCIFCCNIIGGAAFNQEVERFLHRIGFHYTVGYGATECAPIIAYADYKTYVPGSSGRAALHMQVRIDSPDPANTPGEILCKGPNVMLGYYKSEEATKAVLDEDGWFHTGDLGTMDAGGNIFIKGRSKNMLLGSNGQNIYPEEIEDALNSLPMVVESVVVQRNEKLYALVYPDFDMMKNMGFNKDDLKTVMEQNRQNLNNSLPGYSKIAGIEIHDEEFAKTPKRSIKRYLYS
ncbi:MAG: AMP-binding protein, partial [Prevotella sp.]